MKLFTIRRRNAWDCEATLSKQAEVSARIGNEEMPDQVRWIRSYVVNEEDGSLGSVCIYQAVSAEAIREHARRVGMPATEITEVEKTVIVRPDPVEVKA
jgi:hypothetical protein